MVIRNDTCFVSRLIQICFGVLPLLFLFYSPLSLAERDGFRAPGQLVGIGTHRLHINCRGTGSPAVIIDSGLGGFSLEWDIIQNRLKDHVRVCTYDRAGYGWSDPGPFPRTTRRIAGELFQLLTRSAVPGPYVLVGHSFGGYTMRYFASEHPDLVAGMVLIDASHPEQFERLPRRAGSEVKNRRKGSSYRIITPVIHNNYPEHEKRLAYMLANTRKAMYTQLSESDHIRKSAHEVLEKTTFPNVPLVVVSRGKRVWPHTRLGDQLEVTWKELQAELTYLTNMSVQIVANNSGHSIHLDQPELVVSVISKTVSSTRNIEDQRLEFRSTPDSPLERAFYPLNEYFEISMSGNAHIVKANFKDMLTSLRYLKPFR